MSQTLQPPLTPAVFFALFALAGGDKHGYAIMQETRSLSDGSFRLGPATLYTTLQRLLDLGLVQEVPASFRYYWLHTQSRNNCCLLRGFDRHEPQKDDPYPSLIQMAGLH